MSSYTRPRRAAVSSRLSRTYTVKVGDDGMRADQDAKMVAVHASENDAALATELTLDDFGGRSDALGG
jgi:hypothetical protein